MKTLIFVVALGTELFATDLPTQYDLRNVGGIKLVTAVKEQIEGTCWTHGTMAAIESNLLLTGGWLQAGDTGEPNLAEYHLDWWNGFNQHHNKDSSQMGGLTVHQGGDYRVAAAYLSRGEGAVRDKDAQNFGSAPSQTKPSYRYYYVRDIEWYEAGANLENLGVIKKAIVDHGVLGTALSWSEFNYSTGKNSFYQPKSDNEEPNHAVAIVGWDDNKVTQASKPGAWLIKNSWGSDFGDGGFFWISYHDKVSGQHPEMGAVSFQHTEPLRYNQIYSHDYHGWRATKTGVTEAFNAFQAGMMAKESLSSVSFYTAANDVEYTIKVFGNFEGGVLSNELSSQDGVAPYTGFHTVDLKWPVALAAGSPFYVYVSLSQGGHAFDKTSNVPVLLGGKGRPMVTSAAKAGESFYKVGNTWVDLTKDDKTANFCIKGLTEEK